MTDPPQINDLSSLIAENVKFRNTKFLNDDNAEYGIFDYESHVETRARIWRIRNGDLRKMMRRFPTDEPVHDQCALWVRGVAGRQFFPDANHRTAIALLRKLLKENGMAQPQWSPWAIQATRRESKRQILQKIEDNEAIRLDTLYERDTLYQVWRDFFERELSLPKSESKNE